MRKPFIRSLLSGLALFTSTVVSASEYQVFDATALAFTGVTILDGTGEVPKVNQTLLIKDGKITAAQSSDEAIPAGYQTVDLNGHTITPGFVMMHEHMFYPTGLGNYTEMVHSFPRLYLAGGATTIRTAGTTAPYADLNLKAKISDNTLLGPDMDVTAPYLNGPGLPILKIKALRDAENAVKMVDYWQSEGVNSFKLYMHIRADEMRSVIDMAHDNQQKVTGHLCSISFREAADMGIDNLEHGFVTATDFVKSKQPNTCPKRGEVLTSLLDLPVDGPQISALIEHLVKNNVAITSTLSVFETFAKGRPVAYSQALDLMNGQVKQQYLGHWSRIQEGDSTDWQTLLQKEMLWEKAFVDAGGHLMAGTDPTGYGGVIAGWSNIRTIELLVEAGFSAAQAIRIATFNGARFLEQDKDIGSIQAGKRANLAIFDGDLQGNIRAVRNIKWTVKDGRVYDSQAIFTAMQGKVGLH